MLEDAGSCSHLCLRPRSWLRVVGCGSGARIFDLASAGFLLDPDCGRESVRLRAWLLPRGCGAQGPVHVCGVFVRANVARVRPCRRLTGFPPGRGLGGGRGVLRGRDSRVSSRPPCVPSGSAVVLSCTWSDRSDGDAVVFMSPSLLPL